MEFPKDPADRNMIISEEIPIEIIPPSRPDSFECIQRIVNESVLENIDVPLEESLEFDRGFPYSLFRRRSEMGYQSVRGKTETSMERKDIFPAYFK